MLYAHCSKVSYSFQYIFISFQCIASAHLCCLCHWNAVMPSCNAPCALHGSPHGVMRLHAHCSDGTRLLQYEYPHCIVTKSRCAKIEIVPLLQWAKPFKLVAPYQPYTRTTYTTYKYSKICYTLSPFENGGGTRRTGRHKKSTGG